MIATRTTLTARDLPDSLSGLRSKLERAIPHGRTPGKGDKGAWKHVPAAVGTAWKELERDFDRLCDLHPRLVNGSDYPLPAIDLLISTRLLVHRGFVAPEERAPLEEIFEANALLYDLVLKRRLRAADGGGEASFAPVLFESARLFA